MMAGKQTQLLIKRQVPEPDMILLRRFTLHVLDTASIAYMLCTTASLLTCWLKVLSSAWTLV